MMNRRFEVNGDSIGDNPVIDTEHLIKPEHGQEGKQEKTEQRKPFPGFNGVSD